jgi:hypothetical protein
VIDADSQTRSPAKGLAFVFFRAQDRLRVPYFAGAFRFFGLLPFSPGSLSRICKMAVARRRVKPPRRMRG